MSETFKCGHVAVLLNRLRIFKLEPMLAQKPIIAWSAGAMVLAKRIVLFHDTPPQGKGFAEVFEAGLGLYSNLIPLPHAAKRLQLDNPTRVSIFARRFIQMPQHIRHRRTRFRTMGIRNVTLNVIWI